MGLIRDTALAGLGLVALTRDKAEELVRGWVREGEVSREQGDRLLSDLVDRGRQQQDALTDVVRRGVQQAMRELGVVTRADLDELEQRLAARLERPGRDPDDRDGS